MVFFSSRRVKLYASEFLGSHLNPEINRLQTSVSIACLMQIKVQSSQWLPQDTPGIHQGACDYYSTTFLTACRPSTPMVVNHKCKLRVIQSLQHFQTCTLLLFGLNPRQWRGWRLMQAHQVISKRKSEKSENLSFHDKLPMLRLKS